MTKFNLERIAPQRARLEGHPVYGALKTPENLKTFMEHHVFSVWDFMSLTKFLQGAIAPTAFPWAPPEDPLVARFINEIVLEEESDQNAPVTDDTDEPAFLSHFELYCRAMEEVGAKPATVRRFVKVAADSGIDAALALGIAPQASATFSKTTFTFIETGEPHVVAAAFAFGREHIIPAMFRSFLGEMSVTRHVAPAFHYYLERHIHLDEDFHGPLSMRMVEHLIGGDPVKAREAETAAQRAIEARIDFWDGVLAALKDA